MTSSLLVLLFLASASYLAAAGKVRPYGPSPISLNTSNAGDYAEYTFTMTLDTPIISNGILQITFPLQQYDLGLGLLDAFTVYAPYPTKTITCSLVTNLALTEVFKQISCPIGAKPANESFTITVIGVRNPLKVGGTGMFKVQTIYGVTGKILDYNYAFGVIGIAPAARELASASIEVESGYSSLAGVISNWIVSFSPVNDIQSNIDIRILFPPEIFDFSYAQTYQCQAVTTYGYALTGDIQCQFNTKFPNIITVVGNNATIPKGSSVNIRLLDFYNPARQCTTEFFTIYILEKDTNNTIEYLAGVPGLVVNPGTIDDVDLSLTYPGYQLYTNANRDFILKFRPSNPFNAVRIATAFPTITTCKVIYGLPVKDFNTPIVCTPVSNMMTIKGFATYEPEDIYLKVVQVLFRATLPGIAQILNPVQIYTYLDTEFLFPVDQNVSAFNTRQTISSGPATQLALCTMTTTVTTPSGTGGTITFSIRAGTNLAATNIVEIQIGDIFYGIPICQYRPNGGALNSVTCTYLDGIIQVNLGTYQIFSAGANDIQITGLTNPYATRTYNFRINVYSASSTTPTHYGTGSFAVTSVPIATATAALMARQEKQMTPLLVSFTSPVELYDGYQLTSEPFKESSEIHIRIYLTDGGISWFYYNLGYNLASPPQDTAKNKTIPCQAITGFEASTFSTAISCDILLGPTTPTAADYATIRVRDFIGVLSGTVMKVAIPVYNVNAPGSPTTPKMDIIIYYNYEGEKYTIASTTINPTDTIVTNTGVIASAFTAVLTAPDIQSTTTLTLTFDSPAVTATGDNSIVVFYPDGFTLSSTSVMTLDGATVPDDNIVYYNDFLFFTILIPANLAATTHTLEITDVNTPSSQVVANTAILEITSNYQYVKKDSAAIALTPGTFDTTTGNIPFLDVLDSAPNHPYATYVFSFKTTLTTTSEDKIVVQFPTPTYDFTGLTTLPYPENFCNLVDQSKDIPVTGSCSGVSCTVTGFQDIPIGTLVAFSVYGVKNPATSINTLIFKVSTQDSDSNIIETADLVGNATMVSGAVFDVQDLNVKETKLIPNNAIVFGIMSFYMEPTFSLPKSAEISITFPSGFTLYSTSTDETECLADGGLYSIISCTTPAPPGLTIEMVTGERSNSSIPITLYYVGYSKLNTPGDPVAGWQIEVKYRGDLIAQSGLVGSLTTGPSLTGNLIMNIDMTFYPQNEGEQANYYFTFYPAGLLTELTPETIFFIRFPTEYDPQLCLYNIAVSSDDVDGALHAFVVHRDLRITGVNYTDTVPEKITIRVWGVVNPNRYDNTRTGNFLGGIIEDTELKGGNEQILGVIPLLAPDSISLTSLSTSVAYARYQSSFTFTFQPAQSILSSELGGLIYIDFPPDYIIDSYGGNCTINREFSFFVNCKVDNNRITVNATNSEWPVSNGPLTLSIYGINNPDDDGDTFAFVISNYDSLNYQVLGRTYSTLNPASFYYTYDGSQIHVNYDRPIYLEVGTYTDTIYVTLDAPSTQSLTLTPNVLSPDIIFDVFPLKIGLGDTQVSFRIAAPRYILQKTFYIQWAKTGDSYDATYAPLRRTPIVMVSGVFKRIVEFEEIDYIPVGGESYPLAVFTKNPPYHDLKIKVNVLDSLFSSDASSLIFKQGQESAFYSVKVDPTHPEPSTGNIEFELDTASFDHLSYSFPLDAYQNQIRTLPIPINPEETDVPSLTSYAVTKKNQVSATFHLVGTTLAFVYYVYGHIGMPEPLFSDVQSQAFNETLNYSDPVYGVTYIKNTARDVDFTLTRLTPGISYTIYFYIMNLNKVFNPQAYQLNFTTDDPDKPASFIMAIAQNNVSSDLKKEWFVRLSAMISIDKERVFELASDCVQTQLERTYSAPNTTYVQVVVLPDLTNTNTANEPLQLIETLAARTSEIRAFIPRLSGDLIQKNRLDTRAPEWSGTPQWLSADTGSIAFTAKVDACGWIRAVAIPVPLSRNNTASNETVQATDSTDVYVMSYQIFRQRNFTNLPALNTSIRVNDHDQTYELNITGLADKLIYHIFITTENDWPAYNRLLGNDAVMRIEAKTLKIRTPLNIYSKNKGSCLTAIGVIILQIIILSLMVL